MTGRVVNLRTARKRKAREAARGAADASAAKHGRTKSAREQAEMTADLARRRLDGHARETATGDTFDAKSTDRDAVAAASDDDGPPR